MPTNPQAYLKTHSYYSFLESFLSPSQLVQLAQAQGLSSLGLTDHRYLTGSLEFYQTCMESSIQPIIGLEVDAAHEGASGILTLVAINKEGWSNLCRLSTKLLTESENLNFDTIKTHRKGLIAIEGDPRGLFQEIWSTDPQPLNALNTYLSMLKDIFGNNTYLEIQRYTNGRLPYEKELIRFGHQMEMKLIASQNIFYEHASQAKPYRTLTAIRHNSALHGLSKRLLPPGTAHFPSRDDFAYRFRDLPEAIEGLRDIIQKCHLKLPIGEMHFPTLETSNNRSAQTTLRKRALQGAKKIYPQITPQIQERLDHELDIIARMGYEPIFLIVEDILTEARKLGIPTSSRGSAASSLVAHCLKITSPDPMALNLYFERFLNPARKKPPDIDTDIASHRREEIIQYVFSKYGRDRVAMVGTINCYRPKSALNDAGKAHGLSPETLRELSKRLPSSFRYKKGDDDPFASLLRDNTIPIIKEIIYDARCIIGLPKHLSVHPGGIIIAPFPMTDLVPLVYSSSLGLHHAQFDLEGVEALGLVKIDLLGIRGLTVLGEVAERVYSWRRSEFKNALSVLSAIPPDDPKTAETIASANTIGCFQIESPGMRSTLQEIKASRVEDIMAALALYRPGPLKGGLRDAFVKRFRGEEEVMHLHPALSTLLEETFGVILYQEQVLKIAHDLGGLSIAQADILRRAMSHFDPGGVMDTLRQHFIEGAGERRNVPRDIAERIWEMMAAFAGYGFPKAHAASYAQLAWQSAWCKTHFPAEFMAAVLGYGGGYYSQRVYLMEARRLGLTIHPPHINHANQRFRVKYPDGQPTLYMGLNQVRDLTQQTIQKIVQNRPFSNLEDFLLRVNPQRREAENLIKCSALEGLTSIPAGLKRLEINQPPGQLGLFAPVVSEAPWSDQEKNAAQQTVLGVSLMMTPMEQFAEEIQAANAISILIAKEKVGEKIVIAGMRQSWRRFHQKGKGMMCILQLADLEDSIQVILDPQHYRQYASQLRSTGPFLVRGIIIENKKHGAMQMIVEKLKALR